MFWRCLPSQEVCVPGPSWDPCHDLFHTQLCLVFSALGSPPFSCFGGVGFSASLVLLKRKLVVLLKKPAIHFCLSSSLFIHFWRKNGTATLMLPDQKPPILLFTIWISQCIHSSFPCLLSVQARAGDSTRLGCPSESRDWERATFSLFLYTFFFFFCQFSLPSDGPEGTERKGQAHWWEADGKVTLFDFVAARSCLVIRVSCVASSLALYVCYSEFILRFCYYSAPRYGRPSSSLWPLSQYSFFSQMVIP